MNYKGIKSQPINKYSYHWKWSNKNLMILNSDSLEHFKCKQQKIEDILYKGRELLKIIFVSWINLSAKSKVPGNPHWRAPLKPSPKTPKISRLKWYHEWCSMPFCKRLKSRRISAALSNRKSSNNPKSLKSLLSIIVTKSSQTFSFNPHNYHQKWSISNQMHRLPGLLILS